VRQLITGCRWTWNMLVSHTDCSFARCSITRRSPLRGQQLAGHCFSKRLNCQVVWMGSVPAPGGGRRPAGGLLAALGHTQVVNLIISDVLGEKMVFEAPAVTGSEDVGVFGDASGAPVAYWLFGGTDPATFAEAWRAGRTDRDIPSNHQSGFAPVIEPTLETGVQALTAAALSWLDPTGT
jgi:hypothetical protein